MLPNQVSREIVPPPANDSTASLASKPRGREEMWMMCPLMPRQIASGTKSRGAARSAALEIAVVGLILVSSALPVGGEGIATVGAGEWRKCWSGVRWWGVDDLAGGVDGRRRGGW